MSRNELILWAAEFLGVVAVVMVLGLSQRMRNRREVKFIYPRREGLYALGGFAAILAIAELFYSRFGGSDLPGTLMLAALCAMPFAAFLLVRRQPLRSAGWGSANLRIGLMIGLALSILTIFLRNRFTSIVAGLPGEQIIQLLYWLGICLLEESIFRGYIQPRLSAWLGEIPGWVLASALFALWRVPLWLAIGQSPIALLPYLGLTFVQGLVVGYIQRKSGSVLAPGLYRAVSTWISLLH